MTAAPAQTRINTSLSLWKIHTTAHIFWKNWLRGTQERAHRIQPKSKPTDRCVEVCDWRCGLGRRTWAGFNPTRSDYCLVSEVRSDSPLAPVTRDLSIPVNMLRIQEDVWEDDRVVGVFHLRSDCYPVVRSSSSSPFRHISKVLFAALGCLTHSEVFKWR